MNADFTPVIAALAVLIAAITPALVLRLSGQVEHVKQLTNGRMTDLIKRVEELRGELEAVKAGRRLTDAQGVTNETLMDTQSTGAPSRS